MKRIKQSDLTDCGIVCLQYCLDEKGIKLKLPELKRFHPFKIGYYSYYDLMIICDSLRIKSHAYHATLTDLKDISFPFITIMHRFFVLRHFVVVLGVSNDQVTIMDPENGRLKEMRLPIFEGLWAHSILKIEPFSDGKAMERKKLNSFVSWVLNKRSIIVFTLLLLLTTYLVI